MYRDKRQAPSAGRELAFGTDDKNNPPQNNNALYFQPSWALLLTSSQCAIDIVKANLRRGARAVAGQGRPRLPEAAMVLWKAQAVSVSMPVDGRKA